MLRRPGWGGPTPHEEGDFVLVRCGHCSAPAIGVVVSEGTTEQVCPKCSKLTRIEVRRDEAGKGWRIAGTPL